MPKSIFKTIETTSLVDKVEASIVELLQEQKLKVGDSIPKELELPPGSAMKGVGLDAGKTQYRKAQSQF